jgi:cyclic pyranopterin monophosphate synthase
MSEGFELSHLNECGQSQMVDVGQKQLSRREALAESRVRYPEAAFSNVMAGELPKGGILEPARIAGIQAAKRTSELIPMCHPLGLDHVDVKVTAEANGQPVLIVQCQCRTSGRTGVEMEAMTGASVAALTLYDMCKALDKGICIESTRLLAKSGGKSGRWTSQ